MTGDLRREHFAAFFAAINAGARPYRWQERLLDHLLEHGGWPERIVAPTGAGKTSAIDVHVFAQALTAGEDGVRLPRRLAMVVGRRVLVDDQFRRAEALAGLLRTTSDDLVSEVALRLHCVRRPGTATDPGTSPLVVGRLRGGDPAHRAWLDLPTAVAVICATPDMWGSRLLFRGYGASRASHARAAGLLAADSAVVVDEAHLARQLLVTARRVAHLVSVAERPGLLGHVPPLQVVETTATPPDGDAGASEVAVEEADLAEDGTLTRRLTRSKPVDLVELDGWPGVDGPSRRRVDSTLVEATVEAVDRARRARPSSDGEAPATVGCFVNTVSRAVAVAAALREQQVGGHPLVVVLVCGQVRPTDLRRLEERYPGVLDARGNATVDVIVATQSLEVGVDLDLAEVVTELAPATALAQRAGRVNRRGLRASGPVTVVGPSAALTEKQRSGPYEHGDLNEALRALRPLMSSAGGLSPWALRNTSLPQPQPRRLLYQRPEMADAFLWARTSDELAAEPQLDLWLDEDLAADLTVDVVVRRDIPDDDTDAVRLLADMPPTAGERFSVPLRTAVAALARLAETAEAMAADKQVAPLVVRIRAGQPAPFALRRLDDGSSAAVELRPGDVLVVDARSALFTAGDEGSPSVLVPPDSGATVHHPADDVSEHLAQASSGGTEGAHEVEGRVVLRLEPRDDDLAPDLRGLMRQLVAPDGDAEDDPLPVAADVTDEQRLDARTTRLDQRRRDAVRHWLSRLDAPSRMQEHALTLLVDDDEGRRSELLVHEEAPDDQGHQRVIRAVLRDRRRIDPDAGLRQVWTAASTEVTLEAHQRDVAERAAVSARAAGLPGGVVEALRLAGHHHDDGKSDRGFQARLGNPPAAVARGNLLAKSRPSTSWATLRRRQTRDGLPSRWRHEQLSALLARRALGADVDERDLVVRLVGTSHGHGRVGFPHTAAELLRVGDVPPDAAALFDDGDWDALLERTDRDIGVWACAYLEALLRAADNQISEEGR